jgi:RNA 2',3'-cyclic 3'-phosphodiesterase
VRAFIALPLPPGLVASLSMQAGGLARGLPGLAWTAEESWHITLAFLGEQDEAGIAAAKAALAALGGQGCPAPRLSLGPIAQFPPRGPWRVLVAELLPPKACDLVYTRLNLALADAATARGLPPLNAEWPDPRTSAPRRPFKAHVTLARKRQGPQGAAEPRFLDRGLLAGAAGPLASVGAVPARESPMSPLGVWPIEACVLYKSELRRGGAVYAELDRAILAGS